MRSVVWGLALGAIGLAAGLFLAPFVELGLIGLLVGPAIAFLLVCIGAGLLVDLPIWVGAIAGSVGAGFIVAAFWASGELGPHDLWVGAVLAISFAAAACAGLFVGTRAFRRKAHIEPR